jgi:hypothetical protein
LSSPVTYVQLKSLQALYARSVAQVVEPQARAYGAERDTRLAWASANCDRNITSFKNLTLAEASKLIDILKTALDQPVVPPDRSKSKRRSRDEAQRAGTAGRRGDQSKTVQLATAEDLARIATITAELGWDQARLDGFLRSGSSPLKRRGTSFGTTIRTQAQANKVWWALKRIRDRQKNQKAETQGAR